MPWSNSRSRSRKYGHAHAKVRAEHLAALKVAGSGFCAEVVCVHRTRTITADMDLHLCHDRRTGDVRGLGHRACNIREAARWARTVQDASRLRW
jgi:hypothetical protein